MAAFNLPGLDDLRAITPGRPEVIVGLIDGPVATEGAQLQNALLAVAPGYENRADSGGPATRHGTFVASLLFGTDGICPGCCGLVAPILGESEEGGLIPADQFGLARALQICAEAGVSVINVSAGQRVVAPEADAVLGQALAHCAGAGAMVVAAAGNGGCACAELPAALGGVIAVGSHDADGRPSRFSNFGAHYAKNGLLAPGEAVASFAPGGEAATADGTSYAAAVVSGVAALLLSAALERGLPLGTEAVRQALIETAAPCAGEDGREACLAGRLDVRAAMRRLGLDPRPEAINEGSGQVMTIQIDPNAQLAAASAPMPGNSAPPGMMPADCGCGCGGAGKPGGCGGGECSCGAKGAVAGAGPAQLVYALGTLDVDFGTEARRDAFLQAMPDGTSPNNPDQLAAFLVENPIYEQGLTWVLRLDASPVYAIKPVGTYARETAERLRDIYQRMFDQDIEIVSVPGYMSGQVRLLSGVTVPVLYPDARGLYAWDVPTLTAAVQTAQAAAAAPPDPAASVENFLNRVYYEFRNLGVTPQERALNYSATNAFQVSQVFESALGNNMVLDGLNVTKSPICRPESDCWDVVLTFFSPLDDRRARRNYRFTVDVSDVLPVLVGPVRSWAIH